MTDTTLIHASHLGGIDWPGDAVFIVDDALPKRVSASLPEPVVQVASGESLKALSRIEELATAVLQLRSSRPLTLVGVGGGAVGDAIGFLASTLWRGVDLWHVPTTLVAMVDSAHGGKTAVNLTTHKNQLGTFYPAQNVVLCLDFLETLPLDLREEGLVELLKVLWLARPRALSAFDDPTKFHALLAGSVSSRRPMWTELLDCAVDAKNEVVARDPREETGHRRILNLGHTAGHGLEALFGLPHGRAVAWGLAACALLSNQRAGLGVGDRDRLLAHVDPLLTPLPIKPRSDADRRAFIEYLGRDKKQVDGELISILLDGPGDPVQTRQITPDDWFDAVFRAHEYWCSAPLFIRPPETTRAHHITLPPDKSRANRARVIDYLRPGTTDIEEPDAPSPDDVTELLGALDTLADSEDDRSIEICTGDGGTTTRFLMAIGAARPGETTLRFGADVNKRPHDPLLKALRLGGADIERIDDGVQITGWDTFPDELCVDPSHSSQFASALALLAASGAEFRLRLLDTPVSRPYFELTLSMLKDAGVDIEQPTSDLVCFGPTARLRNLHRIEVPPDTSSAVVWRALHLLDDRFSAPAIPDVSHPDRRFDELAEALVDSGEPVVADLSQCPDLAPVLAALACLVESKLTVTDATQLRHKESNRIDGLATSFADVGLTIEPGADGFVVPAGVQTPDTRATFDPRGDHRLAMAALVLASTTDGMHLSNAGCVHKSYPDLWRQARRLGIQIRT